jgi:hypothetical protein
MEQYNYNFEMQTMLTHFASAFDGITIKRFNGEKYEKSAFKIPIMFAPKSHILQDLTGKTDTVKIPVMAFSIKGQGRDKERIKNKLDEIVYKNEDGSLVNLKAVPWNVQLELTILCKYQEDLDQILENFSIQSNPYIIFSWKEPKSGRQIRTEVQWDENITIDYPGIADHGPKDFPFRITATTNFTLKGFLYKTNTTPVVPICHINADIIPTSKFYCNYFDLSAATKDNKKLHYDIEGRPNIRYVNPYYINAESSPTITIQGTGFNDTMAVYVSGSDPDMYPLTFYQPNTAYDGFYGYLVKDFTPISNEKISFTLPPPSAIGFTDIIVHNSCGIGKLTEDSNRCSRVENPYPIHMPEHYNWCVLQFPYLNGLIITSNINNLETIDCSQQIVIYEEETVDKEAIIIKIKQLMELGDIAISELT